MVTSEAGVVFSSRKKERKEDEKNVSLSFFVEASLKKSQKGIHSHSLGRKAILCGRKEATSTQPEAASVMQLDVYNYPTVESRMENLRVLRLVCADLQESVSRIHWLSLI